MATTKTEVGWWVCGEGHTFSYGDEGWHLEAAQWVDEEGYPVPSHCPSEFENGEPCMNSSYLWGPYPKDMVRQKACKHMDSIADRPREPLVEESARIAYETAMHMQLGDKAPEYLAEWVWPRCWTGYNESYRDQAEAIIANLRATNRLKKVISDN